MTSLNQNDEKLASKLDAIAKDMLIPSPVYSSLDTICVKPASAMPWL
jgi:hypothetical protein